MSAGSAAAAGAAVDPEKLLVKELLEARYSKDYTTVNSEFHEKMKNQAPMETAVGVIDRTVGEIIAVLTSLEHKAKYEHKTDHASVDQRQLSSATHKMFYFSTIVFSRIGCVPARDFHLETTIARVTIKGRCSQCFDGKIDHKNCACGGKYDQERDVYVIPGRSLKGQPEVPGKVRADLKIGGWILEPNVNNPSTTTCTTLSWMDMGKGGKFNEKVAKGSANATKGQVEHIKNYLAGTGPFEVGSLWSKRANPIVIASEERNQVLKGLDKALLEYTIPAE